MDGNGRWAAQRQLPREAGHRAGVRAIRHAMQTCHEAGVHILTLYAFSTENWSRPREEVEALMQLFAETIDSEIDEIHAEGIQIRALGGREGLSPGLQRKVARAETLTAGNTRAILNVAINYGGRGEIVDAVRDLARRSADLSRLDEEMLGQALYTRGLPDPDLIIRTAGEMRISNFLLWQAAYAELYVTETLWPDFGPAALQDALAAFAARDRKFGSLSDVAPAAAADAPPRPSPSSSGRASSPSPTHPLVAKPADRS